MCFTSELSDNERFGEDVTVVISSFSSTCFVSTAGEVA